MNINKLVIQDDEGKTTVVPLIREEITIGRKEGNTIRLTERNVSRRHARILRSNGHVQIEDLNSYNGVRVNGSRIQGRCQLSLSDRVQIGDYLIELKSEDGASAGNYNEQKTQPIERIDPLVATDPGASGSQQAHEPTAVVNVQQVQSDAATVPVPAATPQPGSVPPVPGQGMPTAVIGLADTDPAAAAISPGVSASGRLVVLSTNFAGREWELNKPVMVIGRTDENDIVINHRSISRNHAKITLENGRYSIADLNSSNGVRINGEEYGKVELRRGDMVDLGHVRLRFVEPGEDFLFGRDAVAMDVGGRRGPALWFGIGGVALLIAVLIFALRGGGDDKASQAKNGPSSPTAKKAGNSGDTGDTAPAKTNDDKDDTKPNKASEDSEVAAWLKQAQDALDKREWKKAIALAQKALAKEADNERAGEIKAKGQAELKNKKVYDAFVRETKRRRKRYEILIDLFKRIPDESVYKDDARTKHNEIRDAYVERLRKAMTTLANRRQCARIQRELAPARKLWEEAERVVQEALDACNRTKVVAKKKTRTPRRRNNDTTKPKKTTTKPKTNNTGGLSASQLAAQGQRAILRGQWGKAMLLCQKALAKSPGHAQSINICALASCKLRNRRNAIRYMKKIGPGDVRTMARSVCLRNGVQVP